MRPSKARSELSVGLVCHMRWVTYDAPCTCGLVVKHTRWEPDAGKPHVRFVRGAHSNMCPYRDLYLPNWSGSRLPLALNAAAIGVEHLNGSQAQGLEWKVPCPAVECV